MDRRNFINNLSILTAGAMLLPNIVFAKKGRKSRKQVVRVPFKDITIPLLSLGTLRLTLDTNNPKKINMDVFEEMADYAISHGVNLFDTAYTYNGTEEALGLVMKNYNRKDILVADKLPIRNIFSVDKAKRIFEEQLKLLQTDYIDFYMYHTIDKYSYEKYKDQTEIYNMLEDYKRQGIIKYLGISSHCHPDLLKTVVNEHPWDFTYIKLNYADYYLLNSKEEYNILTEKQIPVFVMEPLKGGRLTRHFNKEAKKIFHENFPNETFASFALKWIGSLPNIGTIFSGMENMEHLKQNIDIFCKFEAINISEIEDIVKELAITNFKTSIIQCTNCKYCIPYCPKKINIPLIFDLYEKKKSSEYYFIDNYEKIPKETQPDKCIKCGLCTKNCPQNLQIPELLNMIANEYANTEQILYKKYILDRLKYKKK